MPFNSNEYAESLEWTTDKMSLRTTLSGQSPNMTGTTQTIGPAGRTCSIATIYGKQWSTTDKSEYFVLDHFAYWTPKSAGTYTFTLPATDDSVYVWLGDKALSGYSEKNADLYNGFSVPSRSWTYTVTEPGKPIPLRIMLVEAELCYRISFNLKDPSGKVILSDTVKADEQFNGCGAVSDFPYFDETIPPVPSNFPSEAGARNAGLQWEYFKLKEGTGAGKINYDQDYYGTFYKDWAESGMSVTTALGGQTATLKGTTQKIGQPRTCGATKMKVYGTETGQTSEYFMLQHLGYFKPSSVGDYTFEIGAPDDAVYLWLGDKAKSGFNNANADLVAWLAGGVKKFTYSVSQTDTLIPMRLLLSQGQKCALLTFTVRDPKGKIILSNTVESQDGQFVTE